MALLVRGAEYESPRQFLPIHQNDCPLTPDRHFFTPVKIWTYRWPSVRPSLQSSKNLIHFYFSYLCLFRFLNNVEFKFSKYIDKMLTLKWYIYTTEYPYFPPVNKWSKILIYWKVIHLSSTAIPILPCGWYSLLKYIKQVQFWKFQFLLTIVQLAWRHLALFKSKYCCQV